MRSKGKYQDADFPMGSKRDNIYESTFQSEGATHTKALRQLYQISFEKQQCSQLGGSKAHGVKGVGSEVHSGDGADYVRI